MNKLGHYWVATAFFNIPVFVSTRWPQGKPRSVCLVECNTCKGNDSVSMVTAIALAKGEPLPCIACGVGSIRLVDPNKVNQQPNLPKEAVVKRLL